MGKRYYSSELNRNIEESSYFVPVTISNPKMTEWEQLIADYNKQNQFIRAQKRKWLEPKGKKK